MAPRSKCLIPLIILTFFCTLTALGLFAFHTRIRCWIKTNNETTTECPSSYQDMCSLAPASAFYSTSSTKLFCPWRLRTAITGLASLVLTQILMIMTILAINRKWLKMPLGITAIIVLLALLGALGLMIYDLIDSFQYNSKYQTSAFFRPATYLSNAILVILSTIFIVFTTCFAYRADGNNSGRIASMPNRSQVSDSNHSLNITNTLGNTSKAPVLMNTSMSQVQLPNASEILRDVPVYSIPSGNPNARGNSINQIHPSNSKMQNQSAANSSRALLPQKNNATGKVTPVNTSPQITGRSSGLNISGEISARRSEAYINRQVTPNKSPGQSIRGPGLVNNQGRNQMQIGQPQFSNSPGSRNNISPGRHAASIEQIVPIVKTPVKDGNFIGGPRRNIGI